MGSQARGRRGHEARLVAVTVGWLVACSGQGEVDPTPSDSGGTDTDRPATGGPTGTGSGTGTGGDGTGTGTGTTGATGLDCEADYSEGTPPPGLDGDACVTALVSDGAELYHTNAGGSEVYGYDTWEYLDEAQALERTDLDGPERVYLYRGLVTEEALRVELHSCGPMWLSYIVSGDLSDGVCDTTPWGPGGHAHGTYTDQYVEVPGPPTTSSYDVELIAEGFQGEITNFKLTVERYP